MASRNSPSKTTSKPSSISINNTDDQMTSTFVGTPYKNEDGAFEYPFPTPPLPTPPYQPSSSSTSPTGSVMHAALFGQSRPDSPASKLSSKLVKDGPIPPGLRRGSVQQS